MWPKVPFISLFLEPSRNGINRPRSVRGKGYKMINMGELFEYGRINNPQMELVLLNEKERETFGVNKDDLLFARQSLVKEGAGKCSIVLQVPEITCFEGHIIRVRLDKIKAYPLFYYYYFLSNEGKGEVQSLVMQVAAAGIRGSELAELPISVPPLSIQTKIATILSTYDELIENNLRRIQVLEEIVQNLYREWFVHFRFPGYENMRKINSPLGMIPEGWDIKPISDLVLENKLRNKNNQDIPVLSVTKNRSFTLSEDFFSKRVYSKSQNNYKIVKRGEFAFNPARINIGSIAILNNFDIGIVSPMYSVFRSKEDLITPNFLWKIINNNSTHDQIIKLCFGTVRQVFKFDDFRNVKVILPPISYQYKYEKEVVRMEELITTLYSMTNLLKRTCNLLLPKLISGELDVSKL